MSVKRMLLILICLAVFIVSTIALLRPDLIYIDSPIASSMVAGSVGVFLLFGKPFS
jgi:hypothetical protein